MRNNIYIQAEITRNHMDVNRQLYNSYLCRPLTLLAAPPLMTALMNIPRSVEAPLLVEVLPFTLIPRPAEPESFSGMLNICMCLSSKSLLAAAAILWGVAEETCQRNSIQYSQNKLHL